MTIRKSIKTIYQDNQYWPTGLPALIPLQAYFSQRLVLCSSSLLDQNLGYQDSKPACSNGPSPFPGLTLATFLVPPAQGWVLPPEWYTSQGLKDGQGQAACGGWQYSRVKPGFVAGVSLAVHMRCLLVWDGAGGEKSRMAGFSLRVAVGRLSLSFHMPRSMRILNSNLASKVVMKVNVKVGGRTDFIEQFDIFILACNF